VKDKNVSNVREQVKKILTYPETGYPPWESVDVDSKEYMTKLSTPIFRLTITDGKVYAVPTEQFKEYRSTLYELLRTDMENHCKSVGGDSTKLVENNESSHITVVNSNIVHDCGQDSVREFISSTQNVVDFTITFGKIKSTVSNDWTLFSRCYVAETESTFLTEFVDRFNVHFKDRLKKPIKLSPHTTIAIVPRSLNLFKKSL
ncbi:hypothetical protein YASMINEVIRUS_1277, partial [Yasminevirus sp. GU-2018]